MVIPSVKLYKLHIHNSYWVQLPYYPIFKVTGEIEQNEDSYDCFAILNVSVL